jgi:hypothetical protein
MPTFSAMRATDRARFRLPIGVPIRVVTIKS